ncbi:hypothetical protein XCCB100_4292 [Xanthomonas campestris pv. campestris]|uniref:Uncharacterized protein n=1 Tax=Xanthomonas campestris pv. campestris (strain B100) TaxID=509169 RepID=B0RYX6_XANCB|nr:hypothetical protein XCCB100_4292 [Xanthomonas campestris pv. campestris]
MCSDRRATDPAVLGRAVDLVNGENSPADGDMCVLTYPHPPFGHLLPLGEGSNGVRTERAPLPPGREGSACAPLARVPSGAHVANAGRGAIEAPLPPGEGLG